jgi:hypothetical protein
VPEFQKHVRDAAAVDNARDPPIISDSALRRRMSSPDSRVPTLEMDGRSGKSVLLIVMPSELNRLKAAPKLR